MQTGVAFWLHHTTFVDLSWLFNFSAYLLIHKKSLILPLNRYVNRIKKYIHVIIINYSFGVAEFDFTR